MRKNRLISLVMVVMLVVLSFSTTTNVYANENENIQNTISTQSTFSTQNLEKVINDTAQYIYKTVSTPQIGSIGGEWAILGLARSNYKVDETYYKKYYSYVEDYLKSNNGILHDKKYTEYSRVILALTAIGADPTNVGGYNLLLPLADYDKTIWQGIVGPAWALIALDSGNYQIPVNKDAKTQATRELYIKRILDCQLEDGGWSLLGGSVSATSSDENADADTTGMVLQALANYKDRADVKTAIDKALNCLSKLQKNNGGFESYDEENVESTIQVLVTLCQLGIKVDDTRFVKNSKTILDNILSHYVENKGFVHGTDLNEGTNQMATEQALYGLVALDRFINNKLGIYDMSDSLNINYDNNGQIGLPDKNKDVNVPNVMNSDIVFNDIASISLENQNAIKVLTSRGIINGKETGKFCPNDSMTRAEFSTIVVRALGLKPQYFQKFTDVKSTAWYASYVCTANKYGIVTGRTDKLFDPEGKITKEEAATMVARAATLCGITKQYDTNKTRDILSQFTDYIKSSDWAKSSLALCYDNDILDDSEIEIKPKAIIKRSEVAQMVYNLLKTTKLISE